jgi:Cell Wall Hydrolase
MTIFPLANIIQAEASTPEGQFAVASTILNRANSGLFGSSDPLTIANQPGQFAGNLISPSGPGNVPSVASPFAQQLATATQNGDLSAFGNTGNSLFFQSNQGQPSTVVGGASVNIGGNFFSDRSGQPSANFVAPQFGGTGASNVDGTGFSDITGQFPEDDGESVGSDPLGSVAINQDATGAAGTANFGDIPDNLFDDSQAPTAVASTAGTASSGVGAAAGAGGIAVNLTDESQLPSSISGAGKAVQQGAGTIGSSVTGAASSAEGTLASAISSLENYTSSAFVVVALVVMGVVFVAFGLGLFGKRAVQQIV